MTRRFSSTDIILHQSLTWWKSQNTGRYIKKNKATRKTTNKQTNNTSRQGYRGEPTLHIWTWFFVGPQIFLSTMCSSEKNTKKKIFANGLVWPSSRTFWTSWKLWKSWSQDLWSCPGRCTRQPSGRFPGKPGVGGIWVRQKHAWWFPANMFRSGKIRKFREQKKFSSLEDLCFQAMYMNYRFNGWKLNI